MRMHLQLHAMPALLSLLSAPPSPAHPVRKSCIRSEAEDTEAKTTPQTARPVMTPPASSPAQAAKMKMASLPAGVRCRDRPTKQ